MIDLLGNTQTLLGTIATLAILCLFVVTGEGNKSGSNGNFIFQLISAIGSDVDLNLQRISNNSRSRAAEKKAEIYNRCGLTKSDSSTSIESHLFTLCLKNNRTDLKQKLSTSYQKIDTVSRKILDNSEMNSLVGEKELHFTSCFKLRQEPHLIALMVFLVSMLFLLLDVLSIPGNFIVPFTWFFMLDVIVFSVVVWFNHFSHTYEDAVRNKTRDLLSHVLCGMASLLIPAVGFAVLLYLPFHALSVVFAIFFYLAVVFFSCAPMFRRYRKNHDYSRTIILKHIVYFVLSATMGAFFLVYVESVSPHPAFSSNVEFFREPVYARWLLYIVLLCDLIFIPVYGGYLHMKIDEWRIVKLIKKSESRLITQLDEAMENLYDVIKEILSIEQAQGNQDSDVEKDK